MGKFKLCKGVMVGCTAMVVTTIVPIGAPMGIITVGGAMVSGGIGFIAGGLCNDLKGNTTVDEKVKRAIKLRALENVMSKVKLELGDDLYNSIEIRSIFNKVYAVIIDDGTNEISREDYDKAKLNYAKIGDEEYRKGKVYIIDTNNRLNGELIRQKLDRKIYVRVRKIIDGNN